MTLDNGGPPLETDAKLRWAKINVTEILEGIDELTMEQRGFYMTALFRMYARMGGIPADDVEGARIMRCDVRMFRRLREAIIQAGKFYVEGGLIRNSRVEREIAEFCREAKKRREAALEREAKRRSQGRESDSPYADLPQSSLELLADFSETSPELLPEVSEKSPRTFLEISEKSDKKTRKINGCAATTVSSQTQKCGPNQNQNQNQEPERKEKKDNPYGSLELTLSETDVSDGAGKKPYTAEFEAFWKSYPDTRNNSKHRAWGEWKKLKAADRDAAKTGVVGYAKYCQQNPDYRALHCERFLKYRRYEGYLVTEAQAAAEAGPWWSDAARVKAMTTERWRKGITKFANGKWPVDKLGPAPGSPRCIVPREIIREMRLDEIYDQHGLKNNNAPVVDWMQEHGGKHEP